VEYYIIEMNPEPNCLRSNSSVRKLFLLFCFTFVFVFKIKNYQFVSFVINSNYPSSQSQSLAITNSFFSLDALFFLFMSINSKAENTPKFIKKKIVYTAVDQTHKLLRSSK